MIRNWSFSDNSLIHSCYSLIIIFRVYTASYRPVVLGEYCREFEDDEGERFVEEGHQ